jgi:quinol monooxygenase YgiN
MQKGNMMVGLEILVNIQSGKRQEFLQAVDMFSSRQASENPTNGCTVFEAVGTPNQFFWMEQWADRRLLDDYLKTEGFKALLGAIEVLGKLERMQVVELKTLPDL